MRSAISLLLLSAIASVGLLSMPSEAAPSSPVCPTTYSLTLYHTPNRTKRTYYILSNNRCTPIPIEASNIEGFHTGSSIETRWYDSTNCTGRLVHTAYGPRPYDRFSAVSFTTRCVE
ncbi:uncharacterized protein VTP21DRAFT_9178 [Calcarisporiella thermophila]|uniref:uncharacterized protein n=1 Tax=Calcarisporiella thermophila TaxID=911321 RepID=UPI003742E12A